jgi:hypothetical protein
MEKSLNPDKINNKSMTFLGNKDSPAEKEYLPACFPGYLAGRIINPAANVISAYERRK